MPLTDTQKQLRKQIYQRLADQALQPGDALYEPLYDQLECVDPVNLLHDHIELSGSESFQLFSGCRGSGKTTELLRLSRRLEEQGFLVLYADALEYVNPSEPINISTLLLALGSAFNDALFRQDVFVNKPIELTKNSYWQRITAFLLNTSVNVNEANLKTSVTGPISAGVDLKLELKTSPTFRQNVEKFLASRIGDLRNEAHQFFEDGVKEIRKFFDEDKQVVFILDSLEQLRGSLSNQYEVYSSVEDLFANHLDSLMLPNVHFVCTFPPCFKITRPWKRYMQSFDDTLVMLGNFAMWHNDKDRTRDELGWQIARNFLLRRFGESGVLAFFGSEEGVAKARIEKLIAHCGGNFRTLLSILRETILRADSLPLSENVIEAAVIEKKNGFLPLSLEDRKRLEEIAANRACIFRDGEVHSLARLIDTQCVLYFSNGNDWYDIHPFLRVTEQNA